MGKQAHRRKIGGKKERVEECSDLVLVLSLNVFHVSGSQNDG